MSVLLVEPEFALRHLSITPASSAAIVDDPTRQSRTNETSSSLQRGSRGHRPSHPVTLSKLGARCFPRVGACRENEEGERGGNRKGQWEKLSEYHQHRTTPRVTRVEQLWRDRSSIVQSERPPSPGFVNGRGLSLQ
ncbi:uncharacterized protein LOC144703761 [Wolffia australiana]